MPTHNNYPLKYGNMHILWYYVTLLYLKIGPKIDCVVYMGLYNFMKEIPEYIFRR